MRRSIGIKDTVCPISGEPFKSRLRLHSVYGLVCVAFLFLAGTEAQPAAAQVAEPAAPGRVEPATSGNNQASSANGAVPVTESASTPPAAYLQGAAALPSAEVEAWLANPTMQVPENVESGTVNYLVRLAGSDGRTITAMIDLAEADETPLRINQISRSLARTRTNASQTALGYAGYVDEQVAMSSSLRLIEAYQAALQEGTAAINAGAVAAGPDGGSLSGQTAIGGGDGTGAGGTVATAGFDTLLSASYSGSVTSRSFDESLAD